MEQQMTGTIDEGASRSARSPSAIGRTPLKVDLRSDTVTLPTPEMLGAMTRAPLGDDMRERDPTVVELEALAARMTGTEAGLFVTSGTMGNLVAMLAHTGRRRRRAGRSRSPSDAQRGVGRGPCRRPVPAPLSGASRLSGSRRIQRHAQAAGHAQQPRHGARLHRDLSQQCRRNGHAAEGHGGIACHDKGCRRARAYRWCPPVQRGGSRSACRPPRSCAMPTA